MDGLVAFLTMILVGVGDGPNSSQLNGRVSASVPNEAGERSGRAKSQRIRNFFDAQVRARYQSVASDFKCNSSAKTPKRFPTLCPDSFFDSMPFDG